MTPLEVLARIEANRRALARSMEKADEKNRDGRIQGLLVETCQMRRDLLVADFERSLEVAGVLKPVFDWLVWKRELASASSNCRTPAQGAIESYEEVIAEIGLQVRLSDASVDVDELVRNSQKSGTSGK